IQLYQAFGYEIPQFAHLPMILGPDKTRLSKRHGATAVTAYDEMGYLPESMVNYLVRLGWSCKDQEVFSTEELIEKFSLEHVGKSAAVFNPEKLLWLNSHYIAHLDVSEIIKRLRPFLIKEGLIKEDTALDEGWMGKVIQSLRERCRTLVEMANAARYFFLEDVETDPEAAKKFLVQGNQDVLEQVLKGVESLPDFSHESIDGLFKSIMEHKGIKMGQVAQPVRVALTGRTVSPGIFEVMDILGRKKVTHRLRNAISRLA
ncbi:MAG: glutamate--tRNA ligase family protein, partial [Nitrospira sp.]|nr:glutamate--tRNA ligase family protein [Nitrospira sp.]